MYKALYRKYRPAAFSEVVGQDHITGILKAQVRFNRISHAYLFCGSRGTGKTTSAKILAKAANCLSPIDGDPCGKCASCRAIDSGMTLDVIEMDAASNNGVNDIRDVIENVSYTAAELKYRVYIIDEVHMLSTQAFNALLKTLEEPPSGVIFILATTELHKLPATIVSRCQRHDFNRIETSYIVSYLSKVAESEGIKCSEEALYIMAKLSQGGMRDALGYLELCASGAESLDPVTVAKLLGTTDNEILADLVVAIAKRETSSVFELFAKASEGINDLSVLWFDLISFYRDMLVIKTTDSDRFLDLLPIQIKRVRSAASLFSTERMNNHLGMLSDAVYHMQRNPLQKNVIAEMTLLRLCLEKLDSSYEALLSRISELEDKVTRLSSGVYTAPHPKPDTVSEPENAVEEPPAEKVSEKAPEQIAKPMDKTVYRPIKLWPQIVSDLKAKMPSTGAFITQATGYEDLSSGTLKILFNSSIAMILANQVEDTVKDSIFCTLGGKYTPEKIIFAEASSVPQDTLFEELISASDDTEIM